MIRDASSAHTFTFYFNGQSVKANPGDSIAAALLCNGIRSTRKTRTGNHRGPFCMMGACYDCLVEINDTTVQSCMVTATPGIEVFSASPVTDSPTQHQPEA
ncbi:MAG: (2Fe-2S)-binding protein [Pseudomonadota bacterium]